MWEVRVFVWKKNQRSGNFLNIFFSVIIAKFWRKYASVHKLIYFERHDEIQCSFNKPLCICSKQLKKSKINRSNVWCLPSKIIQKVVRRISQACKLINNNNITSFLIYIARLLTWLNFLCMCIWIELKNKHNFYVDR